MVRIVGTIKDVPTTITQKFEGPLRKGLRGASLYKVIPEFTLNLLMSTTKPELRDDLELIKLLLSMLETAKNNFDVIAHQLGKLKSFVAVRDYVS